MLARSRSSFVLSPASRASVSFAHLIPRADARGNFLSRASRAAILRARAPRAAILRARVPRAAIQPAKRAAGVSRGRKPAEWKRHEGAEPAERATEHRDMSLSK